MAFKYPKDFYDEWARLMHWPQCWDTSVYPTLHEAITAALEAQGCSECAEAIKQAMEGYMATHKELKEVIDNVAAIKVDGFDNDWLLRAFARKQALINIEKIKPYTDKYSLIVRYLMTGDEGIREEVRATAATAATAADYAAAYAAADYAAAYAADAAAAAAYAAADYAATADADAAAYSHASGKAIITLNEMVEEYMSKLDIVKRCECCGQIVEASDE